MVNQHYRWDFVGLSSDEKPTPETSEKVVDGSTFYCSDTSKLYVYCKDDWYERLPLGGGGGTSYTAGDGIDITNDTISVNTETIQPKLTAGTNITISEDNVISAEGGGATVVQTTGTSTTDVMSQKAVTDTLFHNGDTTKIQIGNNSSSTGGTYYASIAIGKESSAGRSAVAIGPLNTKATTRGSIAIGDGATTSTTENYGISIGDTAKVFSLHGIAIGASAGNNYNYSVALGANAQTTRAGEVNVGTGGTGTGYNSTTYRVIGGLHDGQSAHDAVTVEQVNATIDAINTALSTNIPHIGATS